MAKDGLINCKKCGTLFFKKSEREICDECYKAELELIDKIADFVNSKENKQSLDDIYAELNIPVDELEDLVSRGRLFRILPKISIKCRFCGVELQDDEKTGFTCKKCLMKFSPKANELERKGLLNADSFEKKARTLNRRLRGGMNTLEDEQQRYGFIQNYDL